MESPVRYARSGDVHLAYRVFGEGPRDIVLIPGTLSHVEVSWEIPSNAHLLKRLTAFARVIVFDKRGQGLSDRVGEQTIEERIGDVCAVMDVAGSERATIYGWSEGGPMCLLFAATYPERTSSLVLYGSFASQQHEPHRIDPLAGRAVLERWYKHWGEGVLLEVNAPSMLSDEAMVKAFGRLERASASPGSLIALMRANYEIDVRHVLPTIGVPTLILHRTGDKVVSIENGRYLASQIAGARFVEIPGTDHTVLDKPTQDVIADEIEEFVTGERHGAEPDRVLATVLFTDLVGSTERAAKVGDSRWHELRDEWLGIMRKELGSFHGREIDSSGDGLLATFDGPARAIRCAIAMRERVRGMGLELRAGLHTGECELAGERVVGIAVHIGARVAALAAPNEILVSSTVKDLVAGSGLKFDDRGAHALRGVPDEWRLFVVQ
ncbi:MAG TPA: adenylate/guanylate cyclase domain-containing protein [Myxococcota bacterium]|nr:adenylate/guanylate cyclase domain-containing protein [Myxococcota bacterium]